MRKRSKYVLGGTLAVVVAMAAGAAYLIAIGSIILPGNVSRPAGSKPFAGTTQRLLEVGTARHGDTSLSPIGRSCNTCHLEEDSYNATFSQPFPHHVRSVRWKTGLSRITAEGMVQFCMISAMEGKPLPWDSETLAALTAFVLERHKSAVNRTTSVDPSLGGTCGAPPG
jgi:hypothetical protein